MVHGPPWRDHGPHPWTSQTKSAQSVRRDLFQPTTVEEEVTPGDIMLEPADLSQPNHGSQFKLIVRVSFM
jgi:hypothetical protein